MPRACAILPGLVRYDEVASGEITHALRFTTSETRRDYVWPARHFASDEESADYPPMGQRFRLKADFDISGFSPEVQVILQALKTYGMVLADNGSPWFISGVPDERWNNDELHDLGQVLGSDLEAVDVSSLMVDPDSGSGRRLPDRQAPLRRRRRPKRRRRPALRRQPLLPRPPSRRIAPRPRWNPTRSRLSRRTCMSPTPRRRTDEDGSKASALLDHRGGADGRGGWRHDRGRRGRLPGAGARPRPRHPPVRWLLGRLQRARPGHERDLASSATPRTPW